MEGGRQSACSRPASRTLVPSPTHPRIGASQTLRIGCLRQMLDAECSVKQATLGCLWLVWGHVLCLHRDGY